MEKLTFQRSSPSQKNSHGYWRFSVKFSRNPSMETPQERNTNKNNVFLVLVYGQKNKDKGIPIGINRWMKKMETQVKLRWTHKNRETTKIWTFNSLTFHLHQRSSRQMSTKEAKIFKEETIVRNRKKLEEWRTIQRRAQHEIVLKIQQKKRYNLPIGNRRFTRDETNKMKEASGRLGHKTLRTSFQTTPQRSSVETQP